jgi:hypothetical protein
MFVPRCRAEGQGERRICSLVDLSLPAPVVAYLFCEPGQCGRYICTGAFLRAHH